MFVRHPFSDRHFLLRKVVEDENTAPGLLLEPGVIPAALPKKFPHHLWKDWTRIQEQYLVRGDTRRDAIMAREMHDRTRERWRTWRRQFLEQAQRRRKRQRELHKARGQKMVDKHTEKQSHRTKVGGY